MAFMLEVSDSKVSDCDSAETVSVSTCSGFAPSESLENGEAECEAKIDWPNTDDEAWFQQRVAFTPPRACLETEELKKALKRIAKRKKGKKPKWLRRADLYCLFLFFRFSPTAWKAWGSSNKVSGWFGAATRNLEPGSPRVRSLKVPLLQVRRFHK